MKWFHYACGFVAGAALASYLTLSCAPTNAQSVPDLIDAYALRYGVPAWRAHKIVKCESGYLNVANYRDGRAKGIYQFIDSTWAWASPRAGWAGYSVWDVEANVATALWLMARGQYQHWRACGG